MWDDFIIWRCNQLSKTALMIAVAHHHIDIAEFLVVFCGADVNLIDEVRISLLCMTSAIHGLT